jgi:hypothetical protein
MSTETPADELGDDPAGDGELAGDDPAGDGELTGEDPAGDDEFDDDEHFDPVGTVVLIGIYMAIVVGMWIFTYFVEFLGRGLTIVG